MGNSIKGITKMKIEIELPEDVFLFFKIRSIYHKREINKEIVNYLEKETKNLIQSTFEEAIHH